MLDETRPKHEFSLGPGKGSGSVSLTSYRFIPFIASSQTIELFFNWCSSRNRCRDFQGMSKQCSGFTFAHGRALFEDWNLNWLYGKTGGLRKYSGRIGVYWIWIRVCGRKRGSVCLFGSRALLVAVTFQQWGWGLVSNPFWLTAKAAEARDKP